MRGIRMNVLPGWVGVAVAVILVGGCAHAAQNHPTGAASVQATAASVSSSTGSVAPNAADAAFVTTLARLSTQDLTMAGLVAQRTAHPKLAELAARIRQQRGEVEALRTWLNQWTARGVTATPTAPGLSTTMMRDLAALRGASFDDSWMEHLGANFAAAIRACDEQLAHGVNPEARRLAEHWRGRMRSQLNQLRQWHASWMHDTHFPGSTPGAQPSTHHPEPSTHHPEPSTHHPEPGLRVSSR